LRLSLVTRRFVRFGRSRDRSRDVVSYCRKTALFVFLGGVFGLTACEAARQPPAGPLAPVPGFAHSRHRWGRPTCSLALAHSGAGSGLCSKAVTTIRLAPRRSPPFFPALSRSRRRHRWPTSGRDLPRKISKCPTLLVYFFRFFFFFELLLTSVLVRFEISKSPFPPPLFFSISAPLFIVFFFFQLLLPSLLVRVENF